MGARVSTGGLVALIVLAPFLCCWEGIKACLPRKDMAPPPMDEDSLG